MALVSTPAMLIFDDAHHMDEASRELIGRLVRAEADAAGRRLVIITRQSDELIAGDPAETDRLIDLELEPLTQAQLEELINLATEEAPLRPHETAEIARRSAGNSLFLFELLAAMRATGSLESLPDSIESLVAAEIDRLAPTDRMILRYAAVLGATVDPNLLIEAVRNDVDLDEGVWRRLAALLKREPNGMLQFRNALIRDAAYEGLPYRRRRVLHDRVGATIEARAGDHPDEEVGVLALHFHEAQRWDKTWRYGRQAADRAMTIYAIADASRFYELSLEAGQRLRSVGAAELADVYVRWSDALDLLGRYDAAHRAMKSARRLVKRDPVHVAPIAIKQATIATRTGQFRGASLRVSRALRDLEGVRGHTAAAARARLMIVMTGTRLMQNRRVESIRWARQAEREAQRASAKDALADAYRLLDLALMENGELEKAVYSGQSLELYEELGDLRGQAIVLNNLGLIAQERSDWDKALELYRRVLEIMDMMGDRASVSVAKYNVAEILNDQGRLDEAEVMLREVLRVWRASGNEADAAEARRELGRLFARRAEFDTARELLEAAHAAQTADGRQGEALATAVRLSELDVLAGESTALARIETTVHVAKRTEGGSVFMPVLDRLAGWALAQAGQPEAAASKLEDALVSARSREDVYEMALLLDALIAVRGQLGLEVADLEAERAQYVEKLGIVRMPSFRLSVERPLELVP